MSQSLKTSFLLMDDDPVVARVLQEQLAAYGIECTSEPSVSGALRFASQRSWTAALVDEELGGQNCVALAKELCKACPGLMVIALTQGRPTATMLDAVRGGLIFGTLSKPWLREDLSVLLHRLNTHLDQINQIETLKARPVAAPGSGGEVLPAAPVFVPSLGASQGPEVVEVAGNNLTQLGSVIPVVSQTLRLYLPNLGSAARRGVALCQTLVQIAAVTPAEAAPLLHAAALHDLSLVKLDRALVRRWLRDPARCSPEELATFKRHPEASAQLLAEVPSLAAAAQIIRHHHEHFDGTGYPNGLRGESIPWPARLLAVVVAFSYHHGSVQSALKEIEMAADRRFDPEAVKALKAAVPLTTLPRGEREVLLGDLRPGMVLAEDVLNTHRAILLPKGRNLSEKDVMRLLSINKETPLAPVVLVEE